MLGMSCASYDADINQPSIALDRDEARRFDEPSLVTNDPASPFRDVTLQRGRVGLIAAKF